MKKVLVLCMVLFCLGTVDGMRAGDLDVQRVSPELRATPHLGNLGTVYVNVANSSWEISVPAPRETVTGTSPVTDFSVSGGMLTMRLEQDVVCVFKPGDRVNIGVGVQLSGGYGIYEITVIGK